MQSVGRCVTIQVRLRLLDGLATALWATAMGLLVTDTVDGSLGLLGAWAIVASAGAATLTVVGWGARHLAAAVTAYELGLRSAGALIPGQTDSLHSV